MKIKYLPALLIVTATAFVSCKKEQQGPLSGKWQETKLTINVYNGNVVSWDTTYLSPFTSFDYMQFNNNGSCVIGGDFYLNAKSGGLGFSKPVRSTPIISNYNYAASGSVYIVTSTVSQPPNFAGATTADTVSIHGNTLLLHTVNYGSININSVIDYYFTREPQ